MQHPGGYTYILSNKSRTIFYIGVTSDLRARVYQHREENGSIFTSKYKCFDLVFYEWYQYINHAIEREKQLKNWHRDWKINLIKEFNPEIVDLSYEL